MSPLAQLRRILWNVFLLVGAVVLGLALVVAFMPGAHR